MLDSLLQELVCSSSLGQAVLQTLLSQQVVPLLAAHLCPKFVMGEEHESKTGLYAPLSAQHVNLDISTQRLVDALC